MNQIRQIVVVAMAVTAVLPLTSFADTLATANSNTFTAPNPGGTADSHTITGGGGQSSVASSFAEAGTSSVAPYANSAASAFATEGALRASVASYAVTAPGPYPYLTYYNSMQGRSFARAQWNDTLTINAGPVLLGGSGYITARMALSGNYSGSYGATGINDTAEHYESVAVLGTGMGSADPACGGYSFCGLGHSISWGTVPIHDSLPSIINLNIPFLFGYGIGMSYTLDLQDTAAVTTGTEGFGTYSTTLADFSLTWNGITGVYDSTGRAITDFRIASVSGFDYLRAPTPPNPATVPEPETYGLVLAALGIMGALAKRRQKDAQ